MPEEKQEISTSLLPLPSLSTALKGMAGVVALGLVVSTGFAAYNYWNEAEETAADEDE